MKFKNYKQFFLIISAVILTLGLSISFQSLLAGYTPPLDSPPTCASGNPGCDAPLDKSSYVNAKSGPLWINTSGIGYPGLWVTGKVGIGSNAPSASLQINPPVSTEGLRIISDSATSPLNIRNNANTADIFRIDQSGTLQVGAIPWSRLSAFPTACTSGQYITAVGASLTCSAPSMAETGDAVIGNEVTNVTNSTLVRSGSGTAAAPYTLGLNLGRANTWTGSQTFNANTNFPGSGIWNNSGNVGIGVTTLTAKLQVSAASGDLLLLQSGATEKFKVDNTGNIRSSATIQKDASGNVIIRLGN